MKKIKQEPEIKQPAAPTVIKQEPKEDFKQDGTDLDISTLSIAESLKELNSPQSLSRPSTSQLTELAENFVIPHFHGISFKDSEINNVEEFYSTFVQASLPLYSQVILENAYIDYKNELTPWQRRLLDDFYARDEEEILRYFDDDLKHQIHQEYVNTYRRDAKELYPKAQEKIDATPRRDFKLNKDHDIVIATSKLPRHATMFALSYGNFETYIKELRNSSEGRFLGFPLLI